ncbi:MAG: hypothetical protein ABIA97_04140 [Candidatus Omnitrophota bacterium]
MFRKEILRKTLIFICFFAVLTVYWKHPVHVFENVINSMLKEGTLPSIFVEKPRLMLWTLLAYNYFVTLGSAICLIYLFTRPKVKKQFIKEAKTESRI